ncbi:MAG: 30S ribosomal protein S17 [Solirubrobacteraceae bacterium]
MADDETTETDGTEGAAEVTDPAATAASPDSDAEQEHARVAAQSEAPAAASTPAAAPPAAAPAAAPQEVLAPKERRRRARALKASKRPAGSQRGGEERQAERDVERGRKAVARRAGRTKASAKYKAEAHSRVATPAREHVMGQQKVRQGVVVSDKADKTITVRIDTARRHRRYAKVVRTSQTLHAHDEANDAHTGDTVIVREARPLSRTKRWRLVQVLERAK